MTTNYVDLDVRPILRSGGEPFADIMRTVAKLGPNDGLRLFATFKPAPLFKVLGSQGFTHEAREIGGGDWEVLFTRTGQAEAPAAAAAAPTPAAAPQDEAAWPAPVRQLDNRELDPPEPMVRILAELETMQPGEVLSALLCREPMFLFPELEQRGHKWQGGFEADGTTYKVLIRLAGGAEAAA